MWVVGITVQQLAQSGVESDVLGSLRHDQMQDLVGLLAHRKVQMSSTPHSHQAGRKEEREAGTAGSEGTADVREMSKTGASASGRDMRENAF